ncbi:hypothetical protein HPB51_009980 [Rhipicephalus microplus]|uniref:Uncharacterized protein n=1 Tax=Rhipicephalus microplus TaxID=6941 RepID=A0A9J6ESN6_RHIMP|nr:hypothetical protein HPB51_009980 [Rhipicephalus microplus]
MRHRESLLKALRLNRTVESVVICGMDAKRTPEDVAAFKAVKSISLLKRSFASYLVNTDTLRKLRFISRPNFTNENAIRSLVIALCQAKRLVEVKADLNLKMVGFAARVSLFAQVVAENTVLRRLRLPSVKCPCAHSSMNRALLDPPDPDSADKMVPWLAAVRKNTTLRELEIDLGGFGEPECRDFFEAVADNSALHSVLVRRLPSRCPVDGICETIRKRKIANRVLIRNHHVSPVDVTALPECPEITGVIVSSRHFAAADVDLLSPLFKALSQCSHVTSLSVHCWDFSASLFESLITYLGATKTLEKIEIRITTVPLEITDEQHLDIERRLVEAIASIPRLVEVNCTGVLQYYKLGAAFAGAASAKRRRLTRVQMTRASRSSSVFTNLYTPQELARPSRQIICKEDCSFVSEADAVREITARNRNDVYAAARYVLGKLPCDSGARVIEDVHDHPWLVQKVRRLAEVDVRQAKHKIERSLKRLRNDSIDEYMRLTGVVKKYVVSVEGDRPVGVQITDINEDCWRHIRSFLKVFPRTWLIPWWHREMAESADRKFRREINRRVNASFQLIDSEADVINDTRYVDRDSRNAERESDLPSEACAVDLEDGHRRLCVHDRERPSAHSSIVPETDVPQGHVLISGDACYPSGCSVSVPHDHTDFERRAFHDSSAAASTSATSQVRQRDSFELAPTGSNEEQVCERGSVDSLLAFRERLQAWALQSRASHTSVTSLLRVLQSHECFSALPSTARALLQTPKKCLEVLQLAGGKYHHFGLSAGLQRVLQDCAELPRILKLSFNIDGLPVSKSSRGQFWCILGRISNLEDKAPFIVGVFFGSSKPNNAYSIFHKFT